MTISAIALFLLLAQNPTPQQQPTAPAAPASIEGVVAKADTGEPLAKVTIAMTEIRNSTSANAQLRSLGLSPNSPEYVQLELPINRSTTVSGPALTAMPTASDGRFLIENLKPGTYTIKATSNGFVPTEYGQRGPNGRGATITLKAGDKLKGISLTMTPEGIITGRVVDANGDPLSRALVQAQRMVYQERGRSLVTVQAIPTDDKGEYRLFWLPPGKYYISATPSDDRMRTMTALLPSASNASTSTVALGATTVQSAVRDMDTGPISGIVSGMKVTERKLSNGDVIEEASVPVFYPTALDVSTATPIEVRPGGITGGIDITTRTARVYRVRGTVIASTTGQPIASPSITLLQRNGPTLTQQAVVPQNPNSGGFEIAGIVPGSYYLIGSGSEAAGKPVSGILPIEVRETNLNNIIVTANPPAAINGRIVAGGIPTGNGGLRPAYSIRLEPMIPGIFPGISVATSADNFLVRQDSFVLPVILTGDYRLAVDTPVNTYVQSIRLGGQDVLRDGLHVDGPTNETLEIVVSPNAGRLEGNVSAERQKISNATVVLVPSSSSLRQQTNLFQMVRTNGDGHFTFESIAPGSYKVFAWEDVENLAWFDAEFMRNVEGRGTEILIRESAKDSIELAVIPR